MFAKVGVVVNSRIRVKFTLFPSLSCDIGRGLPKKVEGLLQLDLWESASMLHLGLWE